MLIIPIKKGNQTKKPLTDFHLSQKISLPVHILATDSRYFQFLEGKIHRTLVAIHIDKSSTLEDHYLLESKTELFHL